MLKVILLICLIGNPRMETGHIVSAEKGSVLIETEDGNLWRYHDEYRIGTKVNVYFDDMATETVTDDVIVCVEAR